MKKPRLSFFQGSAASEATESADEPTSSVDAVSTSVSEDPAASHEARSASSGARRGASRIHGAFDALAQAMSGEIDSMRDSLTELGRSLDRTFEREKSARTDAVDRVKGELSTRIDEARGTQEAAVTELRQSAEQGRKRLEDRIEKISGELDALNKGLEALRLDLRRQVETSEHVTALLNNMAGVFSATQARSNSAEGSAAAGDATSGDRTEVESAVERVFT